MGFAGFRTITRSVTLPNAVATGPELVGALRPPLHALDMSPRIRLLGVSAGNFADPARQLSLLDDPTEADRTAGAVDAIRDRFGSEAIGPASSIDAGGLRIVRTGAQQSGPDRDRREPSAPNESGPAR